MPKLTFLTQLQAIHMGFCITVVDKKDMMPPVQLSWGLECFTCVPGTNPTINLAVKANPEYVAARELSLRASHEVAGKTAHCSPSFPSAESASEYVAVMVNLS